MKVIIKRCLNYFGLLLPFRIILMRIRRFMPQKPLVPEKEFFVCVISAMTEVINKSPGKDFGDYIEFGVSRGTSMACVYRAFLAKDLKSPRLIGFDSFKGLPGEAAGEGWLPGDFKSSKKSTVAYLKRQSVDMKRVELVEGWFKQTLTQETRSRLSMHKAGLVMLDCDLFSSSRDALEFVEPLIKESAAIICDDWGSHTGANSLNQKDAFNEFLMKHPDISVRPLPSYRNESKIFLVSRT